MLDLLEAKREKRARERRGMLNGDARIGFNGGVPGVGGGEDGGNTKPVIDNEVGYAPEGTDDYMRDDTIPGLKLARDPADDVKKDHATLEFTDDAGARDGCQVKFGSQSGLTTEADGVLVNVDGVTIEIDTTLKVIGDSTKGIDRGANGVYAVLAADKGLEFSGGGIAVNPGTGITVDAGGVNCDITQVEPYPSAPEFIGDDGDASAGVSGLFSRGDHLHPSTVTGESSWQVDGNANEGKIYAVYKA